MRVRRARPAGGQARSWPTSVGNVALPGCIMPASGTYGFGDEIAGYVDPRTLGAIVTKSLAALVISPMCRLDAVWRALL